MVLNTASGASASGNTNDWFVVIVPDDDSVSGAATSTPEQLALNLDHGWSYNNVGVSAGAAGGGGGATNSSVGEDTGTGEDNTAATAGTGSEELLSKPSSFQFVHLVKNATDIAAFLKKSIDSQMINCHESINCIYCNERGRLPCVGISNVGHNENNMAVVSSSAPADDDAVDDDDEDGNGGGGGDRAIYHSLNDDGDAKVTKLITNVFKSHSTLSELTKDTTKVKSYDFTTFSVSKHSGFHMDNQTITMITLLGDGTTSGSGNSNLLKAIANSNCIKRLQINTKLTSEMIPLLSTIEILEILPLPTMKVNTKRRFAGEELSTLIQSALSPTNGNLRTLHCEQCQLLEPNGDVLDALQKLSNLKQLEITNGSVTSTTSSHLKLLEQVLGKGGTNIEVLSLAKNSTASIKLDVTPIAKALCKPCSIKKLDLSYNVLNIDGAMALSDALQVNTTLEELYLRRPFYINNNKEVYDGTTDEDTDDDWQTSDGEDEDDEYRVVVAPVSFYSSIGNFKGLKVLNISFEKVYPDTILALATSLSQASCPIETLIGHGMYFVGEATTFMPLFDALEAGNINLKTLDLSRNRIKTMWGSNSSSNGQEHSSIVKLCEALTNNDKCNLQHLLLQDCGLGSNAIQFIGDALGQVKSLKTLDLRGNHTKGGIILWAESTLDALHDGLAQNTSIEKLLLDEDEIAYYKQNKDKYGTVMSKYFPID